MTRCAAGWATICAATASTRSRPGARSAAPRSTSMPTRSRPGAPSAPAARPGRLCAAPRAGAVTDLASPGRIHNLDALRAVAVLLVAVFHYRLLAVGWIGVWIFFVISGFLISRILLSYKARFALGDYLGVFYARRALRIFPIYYLYIGLWSVVALVVFVPKDFAFLPLVTYTFNFVKWPPAYDGSRIFSHLWS